MSYQMKVDSRVAFGVPGQAATPGQSIYTVKTYLATPVEYAGADDAREGVVKEKHFGVKAGNFAWAVPYSTSVSAAISAAHGEQPNMPKEYSGFYTYTSDASGAITGATYSRVEVGAKEYYYATNEKAAGVLPLGLVERVMDVPNFDVLSSASEVVAPYGAVTIAVKGDYYVQLAPDAPQGAKVGDAVFAGPGGRIYAGGSGTGAGGSASVDANSSIGGVETSWRVVEGGSAGETILITNWTIG